MRLPQGIVYSLILIARTALAAPRPVSQDVAAAAEPPPQQKSTGTAAAAPASSPAARRLNTSGMSRFELQRMLNDLDERRRRIRASIEPADSVLRLFAADTQRLAAATRPPQVEQDSIAIRRAYFIHRDDPTNRDLVRQLAAVVEQASIDFAAPMQSLNARIADPFGAREAYERSPYAAVISFAGRPPVENTRAWDRLHQVDDTRQPPPSLLRADLNEIYAALSDSAFARYRAELLLAYAARIGDIRQLTKFDREELTGVLQDAAQVSRDIGTREDAQAKLDARLINIGLPVMAVVLIALLLVPLLYKSIDMQRAIFTSGLMLELMTVFLLTAAVIILGLDGRIPAEVIGTLLGGISGYVLGRSVNPLVVDRR